MNAHNHDFGIVLGGGGILGAAWMAGALNALEQTHGLDARDATILQGTSAGSVMASMLASGASAGDILERQLSSPSSSPDSSASASASAQETGEDDDLDRLDSTPRRPGLRPGSPRLLLPSRGGPRRPPTSVLAGLLPEGRGSLEPVGRAVLAQSGPGWPVGSALRVVTVDYETGRRVSFGDADAPVADVHQAVMASCAIPGWFAPITIGGRRYIDGGAWSATNVDLLANSGLERLYVLAPMISFEMDKPTDALSRLERRWRSRVTRRCLREVKQANAAGVEVIVIGPGPQDLAAIGPNLMDARRRAQVVEVSQRTSLEALRTAQAWLPVQASS